jgi:putative ABC transport system permease protein
VVRTAGSPLAFVEPIRRAILAVEPELPVASPQSLEELVAASVAQRRLVLAVLGFFAVSALLLAGIGLYGVVACTVSQRTREIGIRMAIGAPRRAVLGLFLRQAARLAGLGIVLGLLGAVALTRLLASQLYGVEPTDPATFAAVAGLLLVVALGASFLPARRAVGVDPMDALR